MCTFLKQWAATQDSAKAKTITEQTQALEDEYVTEEEPWAKLSAYLVRF